MRHTDQRKSEHGHSSIWLRMTRQAGKRKLWHPQGHVWSKFVVREFERRYGGADRTRQKQIGPTEGCFRAFTPVHKSSARAVQPISVLDPGRGGQTGYENESERA